MSIESAERPTGRLRASDAEREQVATIVRDAVGEGRLDIAEGDQRLAAIYAAKFRDELAPLVADLPAGQAMARVGQPAGGSPRGAWGPPPADWRAGRYPRGRYRNGTRGVAAHTGFVVVVAAALTLLWLVSGASFFWPAIPLFFLVLGLSRHWGWATWRRHWHDDRV
jgi:hypothetical protein